MLLCPEMCHGRGRGEPGKGKVLWASCISLGFLQILRNTIFSVLLIKVLANICSCYDIVDGKNKLSDMIDQGHEVEKVINANKNDAEAVDSLTNKLFPPQHYS